MIFGISKINSLDVAQFEVIRGPEGELRFKKATIVLSARIDDTPYRSFGGVVEVPTMAWSDDVQVKLAELVQLMETEAAVATGLFESVLPPPDDTVLGDAPQEFYGS